MTADSGHKQMALKEAMSMKEVSVREEDRSDEKQESMKREACGIEKNPQDSVPGPSIV